MSIRPIRAEEDYTAALAQIEALFDSVAGTPEGDALEVLVTLVEAYEDAHFPVPSPDPIEAVNYWLDSRGLTRRDLEPFLGTRARVSEIMNRRRPLTLNMIRKLQAGLGIPASLLVSQYETAEPSEKNLPWESVSSNYIAYITKTQVGTEAHAFRHYPLDSLPLLHDHARQPSVYCLAFRNTYSSESTWQRLAENVIMFKTAASPSSSARTVIGTLLSRPCDTAAGGLSDASLSSSGSEEVLNCYTSGQ